MAYGTLGGLCALYPREHSVWSGMLARCYSAQALGYERYGGRGITVCDRWQHSLQAFVDDMGRRPEGYQIDRINVNGNYEQSNCRWVTPQEQALNRRTNRVVTLLGRSQTIGQWATELGTSSNTLSNRIKRGWPEEEIVNRPIVKGNRVVKTSQQVAAVAKTHCSQGHELTAENTSLHKRAGNRAVQRRCRECARSGKRRAYKRKTHKENVHD